MLSKATVKARPTVLWCYKKELGFSRYEFILRFGKKKFMLNFLPDFLRMLKWKLKSSKENVEFFMRIFHEHKIEEQLKIFCSHRKKRMKQLQKKIKRGKLDMKEDDPFELFVAATSIRYCYYAETHKILGQTFGMCILQVIEFLVHFTLKCPLCTWKTCTFILFKEN